MSIARRSPLSGTPRWPPAFPRALSLVVLFWVVLLGVADRVEAQTAAEPEGAAASLEGAWRAEEYVLAGGQRHVVRGRLVFTRDEWLVLFFVMEGEEPRRGSGEGGRYTLEGDRLTFEHLYHLSAGAALPGLPASDLVMQARHGAGPTEPTRVERDANVLTLHFPSGNAMRFRRSGS